MSAMREEMLRSGQSLPVFLHATLAQICPVCRAVVVGEKGWDDSDMNAHLWWHKTMERSEAST